MLPMDISILLRVQMPLSLLAIRLSRYTRRRSTCIRRSSVVRGCRQNYIEVVLPTELAEPGGWQNCGVLIDGSRRIHRVNIHKSHFRLPITVHDRSLVLLQASVINLSSTRYSSGSKKSFPNTFKLSIINVIKCD